MREMVKEKACCEKMRALQGESGTLRELQTNKREEKLGTRPVSQKGKGKRKKVPVAGKNKKHYTIASRMD